MESDSKKSTDNQLNEDLLVEILKRLSAKTLTRFRCVSKSLNSLVSSSFFIIRHHLSSNNNNNNNHDFGKSYLLSLSNNSYAFYNSLVEYPKFESFPFNQSQPFKVVDVIHGVVCLSCFEFPNSIILWNPTIHKFVEIPPSPSRPTIHDLGFGFNNDVVENQHNYYDFKVVRICAPKHTKSSQPLQSPRYEVYSTLGGQWRTEFAGHIDPCTLVSDSCYVNGTIHWITYRPINDEYEMELLMFDCKHEKLKTMELPREFNEFSFPVLFTYGGLLCVWTVEVSVESELWAMEEYGVASSWKKLCVIHSEEDFVMISEPGFYHFVDGILPCRTLVKPSHLIKELRVKEPLLGHLFEETMFLMEAKWQAQSYT